MEKTQKNLESVEKVRGQMKTQFENLIDKVEAFVKMKGKHADDLKVVTDNQTYAEEYKDKIRTSLNDDFRAKTKANYDSAVTIIEKIKEIALTQQQNFDISSQALTNALTLISSIGNEISWDTIDDINETFRGDPKSLNVLRSVYKKNDISCKSNSTPIIEIDELMHEAYFGLIKAVEGFDSSQGTLFMTYATFWIRQAVKRFLDNSGQVIRVPVHKQEQIYKYNQVSAQFLRKYNRRATTKEYAIRLGISERAVEKLEAFMFNKAVISLDAAIQGEENDDMTVADSVGSDVNIEDDIVEKVGNEQLHTQLWEIVAQVLKDGKKIQIMKYRYIDNLSLEEIAIKYKVTKPNIDQFIRQSLRRLRCNSKTKRLGAEMGFWESKKTVDIDRLREWAERGYTKFLIEEEIEYAMHMGWLVKGECY